MLEILLLLILIFFIFPIARTFYKLWVMHRRMKDYMRNATGNNNQRNSNSSKSSGNPFADFFSNWMGGNKAEHKKRSKKIPRDVGEYVQYTDVPGTTDTPKTTTHFRTEEQVQDAEWEDIK